MDQMTVRIEGRQAFVDKGNLGDNPYRYGAHSEAWRASRNGDIYSAAWADGFLDAAHGNFAGTHIAP